MRIRKQGSMKVTAKEDRYINSIVTKRLIPRDDEDHGHSAEAEVQHMSVLPAGHTVDEVVVFKNHFT